MFGHLPKCKGDETFCIIRLNVGRLPIDWGKSYKQLSLYQHIRTMEADVVCLSKVGINWKNVPCHQQWSERTHGQFELLRINLTFNVNDTSDTKASEWGESGLMSLNQIPTKVFKQGRDPSGLGRWV
jgi:hypothetical protein